MKRNLPVTSNEVSVEERDTILSTTELSGVIKYINPDFIRISGFTEEELIGKSHNIVRHPDMPQAAFKDLWATLKAGKSWIGLVKNRCKNGDFYWVNAFATPISENGSVSEYQSVRTHAHPDAIKRAEQAYASINAGKPIRAISHAPMTLEKRLLLSGLAALAPVLALSAWYAPPAHALAAGATALILLTVLLHLQTSPLRTSLTRLRARIGNENKLLALYVFTGRTDEAGLIELAFKCMQDQTGAVIGRVEDAAQIVSSTASGMAAKSQKTAGSTSELHGQTDMVAVAMNELSSSSKEVANNATTAAESSNNVKAEAAQSLQVVNEAISAINELAEEVGQGADVIAELEEDSRTIGNVINVIQDITEQTNLLALNAAIEAARAGEQGRGFAVVADEVRTLAKRTQESTEDIKNIIETLQSRTGKASLTMQQGREIAGTCVDHAARAGESLNSIDRAIQTANTMIEQIALAANEQTKVTEEMSVNVVSINDHAESTVGDCRDIASATRELNGQAQRLKGLAEEFKNQSLAHQDLGQTTR